MKAAILRAYTQPPEYGEFADPILEAGEVLIRVSASAQSQLVKAQASGKHYSCKGLFPTIPGVDGIGRLPDGKRVYFAFARSPYGAMAEFVPVGADHYVEIADEVDDLTAAAIANPGMSSWAALRERAKFQAGESVLINGATGASGKLAVQLAKFAGAKTIIATGRNPSVLELLRTLGAHAVISLDGNADDIVSALREQIEQHRVSVILDYLWGQPAEYLFRAISGIDHHANPLPIRFVQIGSSAGQILSLPGGVLRSSPLQLLGSGIGSVPEKKLVELVGEVLRSVIPAKLGIDTEPSPLQDVATLWNSDTGLRRVFIP